MGDSLRTVLPQRSPLCQALQLPFPKLTKQQEAKPHDLPAQSSARKTFKSRDELKAAGLRSSQAEASVAFGGDVVQSRLERSLADKTDESLKKVQHSLDRLSLTILPLTVNLAIELGSKDVDDSVFKGLIDQKRWQGEVWLGCAVSVLWLRSCLILLECVFNIRPLYL